MAETQAQAKQKAKEFALPNEKVVVEFIKKQKGNITNPKHVLFGGMAENAKRHLVPRRSRDTFKYIQILSKDEQAYIENVLALGKDGLSIYKPENNYWDGVSIDLVKEGVPLDLSNPIDYLKYKMVLSYDDMVASSLAELKLRNKRTYQFVVVREGDRSNITVASYNIKKEAYKAAAQLETNIDHIREFLYLAGKRSAGDASVSKIKSMLATMVEDDPQRVVDIVTATDYATRALLSRAVLGGVVKDVNGKFSLEDGVVLCAEGEVASLSNAIKFLSSTHNADIKKLIEAKLGK